MHWLIRMLTASSVAPYAPEIPMQPIPIEKTCGPAVPSLTVRLDVLVSPMFMAPCWRVCVGARLERRIGTWNGQEKRSRDKTRGRWARGPGGSVRTTRCTGRYSLMLFQLPPANLALMTMAAKHA